MTKTKIELETIQDGVVPVRRVTPTDGAYIHRFFDTSPWSPSGRLLVVLRLPFEDREPERGDFAEVCVVDLEARTIEAIHSTSAWSIQMGAQQQWGPTDRFVYFNDIRNGRVIGVRYDLEDREAFYTGGPIYQVAPNGRFALSPDLVDIRTSQAGYGVAAPDGRRRRLKPGHGDRALWRTDLQTGACEPVVRFADLVPHLPDSREFRRSAFLGFHVKFNREGDRVLFVLRAMDTKTRHGRFKRRPSLLTMRPDGTDVTVAMPYSEWSKGGHHPNWHPDGRRCTMNLKLDGQTMRFVEFDYTGANLEAMFDGVPGSGHPSFSNDGRFLVTDAYVGDEFVPDRDGAVPIRLIDDARGECREIAWADVGDSGRGALRCDPHPAWRDDGGAICFNAAPGGRRQVFVAEIGALRDEVR